MGNNYRFKNIPALKKQKRFVIGDANVFIFRFWPKINPGQIATQYRGAFERLCAQGIPIGITMMVLSEVMNRVFNKKWELWNEQQILRGRQPVYDPKTFRDSPAGLAIYNAICEVVNNEILPCVTTVEKHFTTAEISALLTLQKLDFTDKVITVIAKENNYVVFTHDGDFRYTDVDVLTANGKILRKTTRINYNAAPRQAAV
jgi:hypothetical protein